MFLNETSFQLEIENLVLTHKLNYIDAVIKYCADKDIDLEDIGKLVSENLKGKIKLNAMEDGLMKSEATLPI